MTKNNESN